MVYRALPYKKSCIRADKVEAIRQAGYAAQRAAENNDSKEIFAIVRRLAGVSHKPLESLSRPDGTKLTTVEETIAHKRTHFTDLFKAKNAEKPDTHASEPRQAQIPNRDEWTSDCEAAEIVGHITFLPTLHEVRRAIAKLADTGVGEDLLSASLLRAGGHTLAKEVHEAILDAVRLQYVPIAWRGGRLVVLYKGKGNPSDLNSYRGILV